MNGSWEVLSFAVISICMEALGFSSFSKHICSAFGLCLLLMDFGRKRLGYLGSVCVQIAAAFFAMEMYPYP